MKANTKFDRLLALLLTVVMLLGMLPIATAFAAEDTRPAPDRVQSYIAAPGFTATALNPNQAKFTYVEITSNSNSEFDSERSMKATVKCVTVDAAIAKKIGYNGGNAAVNSEDQLSQLKDKLKASSDYYKPSSKTLSFPANSNAISHQDIGKGTFRYLLSVEAYFNGTYYFDGAGINFETDYQGNGRYTVSVQVCGMTIYPDTASGKGDPPTKLKLVIDNQIGREFTDTDAAPKGNYGIRNYPDTYVANFRWICMPNTNLEIELRNNTVLHVGKYFRSSSSSAEIKTNIHADNLTISGNGVLLASNFNNLPYGAQGTAADSAIHANSLTVDSSNVVLDLTRDGSYNCIEVPTPGAFKPINAKSIKLTAANGKWISGLSNDETSLKNAYSAYWDTFTTGVTGEGSSRLSTVTFGRSAGLSDAVLNVGSQEIPRTSAVTKGDLQADNSTQALNIKVKAPKWLTTLKNTDRYDYIYTAAVYENGTKLSNTFNLTTGGSSDGTSTVRLTFAGNFKPTAGKSYIVTFSITPKVKATGEKLESAAINGNWLLTAVEQPKTEISSVKLTSPGMKEGATSGGNFTGTNAGVASTDTVWLNDLSGGAKLNTLYTAKVTLTAENGYVFTKDTTVNVTNSSGYYEVGTPSISADGKTMTVRVLVAATHDHQWEWKDNSDDTHSQVCTLTGCSAKRNTENHTYTTTETATEIKYTCTKCGKTRTETKTGENVIWAISAPVTAPKANVSATGTWVTLNNQYAEDAEITSAKWTEGNADAAAAAEEFRGKFNAYSTYTLTVTFTAKNEKAFKNPQLWRPLQCLDGTPSAATVSTDGKTLTQSITFTIKMPVSVKVTLNDLAADGSIVQPTIQEGRAANSLLSVNINKGERLYMYNYSTSTWTKLSTGDGDATPKLAAGESATLGLALLGADDAEYFARLESTDNVKGLVAGAYAEKNGVYATYAVADESTAKTITSVDLTVTAPEYGKAPATTATGADGANYTVGNVSWNPSNATFGAKEYKVSISVTPNSGYTFAEGCIYTVNGYTATYEDGKVSYTFPALTAPHSHTYGDWAQLDDSCHSRTCTAGDDIQVETHTWGNWATVDGNTHKRTCNDCGAEQTASHNWVLDHVEDATFTAPGKTVYKCADNCGVANKEEPIAQLVKIDVANLTVAKPVKDAAATEASTTDTAYYVAATEWVAADGTPLAIGGTFQLGTVYTVKITLETAGDGVFSAGSTYNQIAGKTAMVNPALTGDGYTDTVILTYTFDATAEASPTEYAITVTDGKATVGAGAQISKATEGTTITLTADAAPSGKVFDKWVVESGSITLADASSATTTFTMPAGAVSVKATYKNAPVATYNLTTQVNGGNGTISASKTGLTAGSTETVIFTPDSGYEIDTVTVNGIVTTVLSNVLDVTMDADKTVIVTYKAIGGSEHNHSYGNEWKNDADNHWHECSCGDKADTAAHSFKWVVDKEATATEKGSKHEECKVCGYMKAAVEIPATGTPTKPTDPTDPEKTTKPEDPKSPQTGDSSMMGLWIALLFVSGGVLAGTTLYSRKKKNEE